MTSQNKYLPFLALAIIAAISITLKLHVFFVGSPYVTIDDNTLYEAGFLVWFGEPPPQRTYIESWVVGLSSILTYLVKLAASGNLDLININLVADAYRDFVSAPDQYIYNYRALMLVADFGTAIVLFFFARTIFREEPHANWWAAASTSLFLLSYNTLWCYLVARPDTMTTFLVSLGTLLYYQSNFGDRNHYFYSSAVVLGIATGFKLHASLFVVFFLVDLIRQLGFFNSIKKAIPFGLLALVAFFIAAGSPLFDPLLYIKLRALNIKDDESPWIQWGDQVITVLRGTGYILAPIVIGGATFSFIMYRNTLPPKIKSILFMSAILLATFLSIRQLRAYWMLPALPIFLVAGVYLITRVRIKSLQAIALLTAGIIFFSQLYSQSHEFDNAHYGEMSKWVKDNVNSEDVIYIIGYDTLFLPWNTTSLENRKGAYEYLIQKSLHENESYTHRHIRLWEERARLELISMLNVKSTSGFNYYGLNTSPLESLQGKVEFSDIKYVLSMQNYRTPEADELLARVQREFIKITTVNAPGGKAGTGGLPYDVYVRRKDDPM